ncbi:MAG: DUF4126 domain-containing protein [Desulfobacterales bacterium]
MESYGQIVNIIALTMGAAWASGINLYAALLVLGLMGMNGMINLPPDLQVLAHPMVVGAAGLMYVVEFFADKVPGVDTTWDTLHTFIRIPAGAILAAGAVGQVDPVMAVVAGILGGTVAAGAHAVKAGTRVLVNVSPEPFSNWTLSVTEDVLVIGGLWTAVQHPWLFLFFLGIFILASIWVIPRLWRGIKSLFRWLAKILGMQGPTPNKPGMPPASVAPKKELLPDPQGTLPE